MKKLIAILIVLTIFASCKPENKKVKESQNLKIDRTAWKVDEDKMNTKIDSLLSVMTIEEKIGQTVLYSAGWEITGPTLDTNYVKYLKEGKLGSLFNLHSAKGSREFQRIAVEETRLGIPLLIGYDVIHGHKTIFPMPLGESASWDLEAIEKSARIAAEEASAAGIHWTYAPMVDIGRDPRWGRVAEGAGEDVYLGNLIAKARVKGFQGDDLSKPNTILACAKHYAAYGAAQGGRDYNTVDVSERVLRDIYLPPFKATVEAGVASFMTSFNEIAGVPSSGSKFLLDDILRKEWGFEGFVVTDYTSINEMIAHGFSENEKHAGEQSMNAGVDMDMQGGIFLRHLKKSIEEGSVSEVQVTKAARRILEMKYRLGLFDDPYRYADEQREKENTLTPEFLNAAKDIAKKSIVLLKNNNQILPLKKSQKIALIGPMVKNESDILGSWSARGNRLGEAINVFEGVEGFLGNTNTITYAKGCEILGSDTSKFPAAIQAAKKADVVVMVLGETSGMSGEAASRTNLDLPGVQKELIAAIKKTGKPIVLVLMNGRPLTLEYETKTADAILETWFSGTMGGAAIAEVLYGGYNPSGKLTMTFPRNVGQIPIHYDMKSTGRPLYKKENNVNYIENTGIIYPEKANPNNVKNTNPKHSFLDGGGNYLSRYKDSPNSPLYPFGYGLSYTNFEYSNLKLGAKSINFNEDLKVSINVKNTGDYDGEEVVQLYVQDVFGSVTRPMKELKGFEKITLKKGESKTVTFTISSDDLKFHDINMDYTSEAGDFKVFVGTNSVQVLEDAFTLKK